MLHDGTMTELTPPPGAHILAGPAPTLLPPDGPDAGARQALAQGVVLDEVVRSHPDSSLGWALLAEAALAEATAGGGPDQAGTSGAVRAYAFARTGYHRGLDALRRAGWRGQGPIPIAHPANQGFLRALLALAEAAARIGERAEAERCEQFLADSGTSPAAVAALRDGGR